MTVTFVPPNEIISEGNKIAISFKKALAFSTPVSPTEARHKLAIALGQTPLKTVVSPNELSGMFVAVINTGSNTYNQGAALVAIGVI